MARYLVLTILIVLSNIVQAQDAIVWKYKTEGKVYGSAALSDNTLFIGSGDGYIYALHTKTGKEIWKFKTGGPVHSTPLLLEKSVVINSFDGFIYCLNKLSGKLIWKFKTGGEKSYDMWDYYLSSPVVHQETIFIGSGDSFVYALNSIDGTLKWKFKTNDIVHASPVVADGHVYIGSFDGTFYSLKIGNGSLNWKFRTIGDKFFPKGEIQKEAILSDSVLYFGSRDYNLYAINSRTGRGEWNMKEYGSWIIATPLAINDTLYFGTSDSHRFYALKKGYGEIAWTLPLNMRVYGSAATYQNKIYFGCFNGFLYGVNKMTGAIEWTFQTESSKLNFGLVYNETGHFKEGFQLYGSDMNKSESTILSLGSILSTPVISDNIIYFGSADGYIYAVRL